MNTEILKWSLTLKNPKNTFEKYCPNCGKKVLFVDSLMRRRNANGKDIYEYAIYKCPEEMDPLCQNSCRRILIENMKS
jgi:hypothetical protein